MKQEYIIREGHPRLLLLFAGWGTDTRLFRAPVCRGYDCLLCYDYRTLDFDARVLAGYESVRVAAWSMGVWVAGRVLSGVSAAWERRMAWNGTPYPINNGRGIPVAVFQATLDSLSEASLAKFRRRMCGTPEGLRAFMRQAPERGWEELRDELAALHRAVSASPAPVAGGWDKAFVGMADRIFPPSGQLAAWEGTPVERLATAHYDPVFLARLMGEEELWTRP